MKYILILILLICFNSFAKEQHHDHDDQHDFHNNETSKKKSLKAHEHGVSILNIAQDENILKFEFEMPGFDVVGFEYEAKKKEDVKKVKNAISILSNYKNMFSLPNEAGCNIISDFADVDYEGSHSEFASNYTFNCKKITEIKIIEILYFNSFENSKKLNVDIVSKNKKISLKKNKAESYLNVEGYF